MGQGTSGPQGPQGPQGPIGPPGKSNLAWNALTDEQKTEVIEGLKRFSELRGPKGDQGPPGKDGVSDPALVATRLIANPDLARNISRELPNVKDFNDSIAGTLVDDTKNYKDKLVLSVYNKIASNQTFINDLAEFISTDPEAKERLKGDPGNVADFGSMKASLITKTLWCADGEFCKLPANYWDASGKTNAGKVIGIQMNSGTQNLSFGDNTKGPKADPNNGLAHRDFFGKNADGSWKIPVDGPFLHGQDGGQLGFVQKTGGKDLQDWALKWNDKGIIDVKNHLNLKGGVSEKNSANWGTHFPWSGDNKNYIRGDTEIRGHVNNIGNLTTENLKSQNDGNVDGNLMLGRGNKWILHTPGDGRVLHIASWNKSNDWDWGSQINIQPHQLTIGNWSIRTGDGHLRVFNGDTQKFVLHAGTGDTWFNDTGYLKDKFVRKDKGYRIVSKRWGVLQNESNNNARFVGYNDGDWEYFKFDERPFF